MSEPKIYTKNYVSGDDVITVSHGSATKHRLYDRDIDAAFETTGANDDSTVVTVEVEFYEGSTAIDRTIDTLIILNHNLADWVLEYWNGSAYVNLYTNAADASADRVVSHTQVTTSKIKLTCNGTTQVADAEKFIGELISCNLTLDVGKDMVNYNPQYREKVKTMTLGDGSMRRAVVRWAPNRSNKYEARITFKFVAEATRDLLLAIKEANQEFLWYPESSARPEEIYLVSWANPWHAPYSVPTYKGAGYDIDLDLKEV